MIMGRLFKLAERWELVQGGFVTFAWKSSHSSTVTTAQCQCVVYHALHHGLRSPVTVSVLNFHQFPSLSHIHSSHRVPRLLPNSDYLWFQAHWNWQENMLPITDKHKLTLWTGHERGSLWNCLLSHLSNFHSILSSHLVHQITLISRSSVYWPNNSSNTKYLVKVLESSSVCSSGLTSWNKRAEEQYFILTGAC